MTLMASADLLSDFKFFRGRPTTDEESTDVQIYRLLTLAQQQVAAEITALYPRFVAGAPVAMTTTDGGITYSISGTDEDSLPIVPFGHAEVYASNTSGELFGSTYAGREGDVVFEGDAIRIPGGQTRTFTSGPYIRYAAQTGTLDATHPPTLPSVCRPMITYRALVLWANRGGVRDPQPYEQMYQQAWLGANPGGGDVGIRGLIATQYAQGLTAATAAQAWWRAWVSSLNANSFRSLAVI